MAWLFERRHLLRGSSLAPFGSVRFFRGVNPKTVFLGHTFPFCHLSSRPGSELIQIKVDEAIMKQCTPHCCTGLRSQPFQLQPHVQRQ
jgi:hypothetical protein